MKKTTLNFLQYLPVCAILILGACSKSSNHSNSTTPSTGVDVSTVAGNTPATTLADAPNGICSDSKGNIFFCETNGSNIVELTTAGALVNFAGNGTASANTFTIPLEIATDPQDNIYVADNVFLGIWKVTPAGVVSVFYQGAPGSNVDVNPQTLCVDLQGNVYTGGELGEQGLQEVTQGGVATQFAGDGQTAGYLDGPAGQAEFTALGISGMCVDASGNVYESDGARIRKIAGGQVTTIAGSGTPGFQDGTGTNASFAGAMGLCCDSKGNIYVADTYNAVIRKVTPSGVVTTIAGNGTGGTTDGDGSVAEFYEPTNICFDPSGNLYVADFGNGLVRKITFK
jgi:streptogramin lyase